jgi:rhomboid protease GluP
MDGEYWRLLTVALVHAPLAVMPLHLLMNMYALWIIGPLAETLYGRATYLAMYMLAALGGSIASYLVTPNTSVGASGAVFGLFGLVFAATYFHKTLLRAQARAITSQIGVLIVINLVIGFGLGGLRIDNSAHIGGLLVGAYLGLLIVPSGAATLRSLWQRNETSAEPTSMVGPLLRVIGIVALGVVLAGALLITPLWA